MCSDPAYIRLMLMAGIWDNSKVVELSFLLEQDHLDGSYLQGKLPQMM